MWDVRTGHKHAEPLKHEDLVSAVVLSQMGAQSR